MTKKIVVFTGAGVSAESGLGTFRGSDGMWDRYRIEDVCTHDAWLNNPQLCVEFYNMRRREALAAQPNAAHYAIARLQEAFPDTQVITQNIDNLHERAGSHNVIHLHFAPKPTNWPLSTWMVGSNTMATAIPTAHFFALMWSSLAKMYRISLWLARWLVRPISSSW